jgi:hypothetical protein
MNRPIALRLRLAALRDVVMAAAALWFLLDSLGWAQFSKSGGVPPLPESSWPAVNWGMEPLLEGGDELGWPLNGKTMLDLPDRPAPSFNGRDAEPGFPLRPTQPVIWQEPVESFLPALPDGAGPASPETSGATTRPAKVQIGNVAFNRTADSLNLHQTDIRKVDDLSRQFQAGHVVAGVAGSVPGRGFAMLGIALMAIVGGVIFVHSEYKRAEKRRRGSGRHRHRQRRTS